ncbi:uncharacterized protein C8Q71DRAFT_854436 [Rhodofomes roseus]|uniref:Uncharacterized protein n=1 Tax=Rhodofomes roseus TaxID=34475 RepID=A0ABQ8KRK5_9APHY|nr:uncharacterized protein C8Q71DRAFT_854436 [Rhodofomes roseus]KAH9840549.1 hypothetical protein C8Q71DRAFT_854436 [Rhodofomes roseus]
MSDYLFRTPPRRGTMARTSLPHRESREPLLARADGNSSPSRSGASSREFEHSHSLEVGAQTPEDFLFVTPRHSPSRLPGKGPSPPHARGFDVAPFLRLEPAALAPSPPRKRKRKYNVGAGPSIRYNENLKKATRDFIRPWKRAFSTSTIRLERSPPPSPKERKFQTVPARSRGLRSLETTSPTRTNMGRKRQRQHAETMSSWSPSKGRIVSPQAKIRGLERSAIPKSIQVLGPPFRQRT